MPDEVVHKIYKVASSSDVVQDDEDSNEVDLSSLNISDYGDLQTFVPVIDGSDSFSINNSVNYTSFYIVIIFALAFICGFIFAREAFWKR